MQPGAFLLHHAVLNPHLQDAPFLVDAVVEKDVELRLSKGRCHFVFHDLRLHVIANGVAGNVLDRIFAADIDADAGVEFQRLAARGGFRIAEHHPDFFADLVGENARGLRLGEQGGEFAKRLAHQTRLHPHGGHAHLPFELGLGHQGGDGIDDDHIERVGAAERFANAQRLFAAVRLRHQQVIEIYTQFFRVGGIQRMFGVDKCRRAASLLRVGDDMQHKRCLARGLRPENLHHAPPRNASNAQGKVQRQRSRGDHFDLALRAGLAQTHDAAFAVGLGDGGDGRVQLALARGGNPGGVGGFRLRDRSFNGFRGHKFLVWCLSS